MIRKILLTTFLLLTVLNQGSYAQDIAVTAELSSNRVNLGSSVQLTVMISGVTNIGELGLPAFDGFDVSYIGPSTHVSIVNGKYYSSKSFTYSLLPQRTGKVTIQPLTLTIDGKQYTTQPMEIEVVDENALTNPAGDNSGVTLKDKINVVLRVPKTDVYINEPLPVKVMLLVTGLSVRDIQFPKLNNIGFMVTDFEQPKQYQQIIKGIRYDIVEFDALVYPTRTGEVTLGPAQLLCNLIAKTPQQRGSGNLFNDEFFNAFFDRVEKRPLTLESEPVTITVKDLPQEGKPEGFSGAIGNYDFDVSAAPSDIREGDPVTLRMSIKGRGNLKAVEFPEFNDLDNFKMYKPNIKEESNVKTLEQVIMPKTEQVKEVAAFNFSFFDPQLGKYVTITKGPFPLTVHPMDKTDAFNVVGMQTPSLAIQAPVVDERIGEDIVFIKDRMGKLVTTGRPLWLSPVYYFIIIVLFLCWLGGFIYFKWTYRLATDIKFARRMKAPKEAKKRILEANSYLKQGKIAEFYDCLFKTLQNYLSHKFHLPAGLVSATSVQEKTKGILEPQYVQMIDTILKECEAVRYASAAVSAESMHASLLLLEKMIDHIERKIK